jgi:hypothetical protein
VDQRVHGDPSVFWRGQATLTVFQTAAALTQSQLNAIAAAAKQRWINTGLSSAQLTALQNLTFEVTSFGGQQLGSFNNGRIRIDVDAAGKSWFVDPTPLDDLEFANVQSATELTSDPLSAPAGRVDLLSTVMHEIGHALGLADTTLISEADNVMFAYLGINERHLPAAGQAMGALPGSIASANLQVFDVIATIGDLPAMKGVRVFYQVTVNSPLPSGVTEVASQGTFSAEFLNPLLTDDPDTPEFRDPTRTPVADNVAPPNPQPQRSLWLPFG